MCATYSAIRKYNTSVDTASCSNAGTYIYFILKHLLVMGTVADSA